MPPPPAVAFSLHVCVCVGGVSGWMWHVLVSVAVHAHMCSGTYGCSISVEFSQLVFETASLTGPEAHQFNQTGWPMSFKVLLSPFHPFQCWGYRNTLPSSSVWFGFNMGSG